MPLPEETLMAPGIHDAHIFPRVCAVFLDVVFLFITLVSIGGVTVWLIPYPDLNRGFNLGMIPLLGWLYFAVQESSEKQATFGKQLLGLKVTDLAGERLGFRQASLRFMVGVLTLGTLCAGFFLAAFTARRQALHDLVSGSRVTRQT